MNPVETYIVNGTHTTKPALPFTPGGDGAGTVSQIGDGVQKVQVSYVQHVFCFVCNIVLVSAVIFLLLRHYFGNSVQEQAA